MQFQNISRHGRISDKVFTNLYTICLDRNSRDLSMYRRIVEIPTQEKKQQYCSDIILIEKRKEKYCSKNSSKDHISPLISLKFLWIIDKNFHMLEIRNKRNYCKGLEEIIKGNFSLSFRTRWEILQKQPGTILLYLGDFSSLCSSKWQLF